MLNTLILLTTIFPAFTVSAATRSPASFRRDVRISHARELMGTHYSKSVVSKAEKKHFIEMSILKSVKNRLPKAYKSQAKVVTETIISEAARHALDPYFVMAVIAGESSFNPLAIGPVGEIGLMQLRPKTAEWIAKKFKQKWTGSRTLKNPVTNIKLGTAYLAWLRGKFSNQSQLYLAAYNMGPTSVKNAVDRNVWPKDYPRHVMKRYIALYAEANAGL